MNSNPAARAFMILTFLFIMPTLKNSHRWKYSDDNALLSNQYRNVPHTFLNTYIIHFLLFTPQKLSRKTFFFRIATEKYIRR